MRPQGSSSAICVSEYMHIYILRARIYLVSSILTKPLCRSDVAVLETEDTVKVEALQALLLEVRIYVSSYYYICVLMSHI
jgi:hypothetical protein